MLDVAHSIKDPLQDTHNRDIIDSVVNSHGHRLMEFLENSNFGILNGRYNNYNNNNNNFTSISTKGSAGGK